MSRKFDRGAENQAFLVESVSAIQTLKAMAIEPQMQRRWEDQLAGYVGSSFDVLSLGNWASQSVQFISKIVTALTLYYGAHLVIEGQLTVGELIAFNMLAGRVAQPVLRLAQVWQDFHQARVSIARLGDILNTTPEPTFNPSKAALPPIKGEITFDHISFRYRLDAPLALHDVSLKVSAGQVIGIVGPSGSGKSTLTKLVQRLYVPESGRILIDGIDLTVADVAWLQGVKSARCCRKTFFSTGRSRTTLPSPILVWAWGGLLRRQNLLALMNLSWACRTDITPLWVNVGRRFQVGSGRGLLSPALWSPTQES